MLSVPSGACSLRHAAFQMCAVMTNSVRNVCSFELHCCLSTLIIVLCRRQAYERAIELDPSRLYSTLRAGGLQLALGASGDAAALFEAALRLSPDHPAALLGMAQTLLEAARSSASLHATGTTLAAVHVRIYCAAPFASIESIPHRKYIRIKISKGLARL